MISEETKIQINSKYLELIEHCKPLMKRGDLILVNRAYEIAYNAEIENYANTGEFNICHNIDVAKICVDQIGLGITSVICALLYHVVTFKYLTLEEIESQFGKSVAVIIEDIAKISELRTEKISLQSENFRKLFLTLIDDIRVILIKLAHRLNDMRNVDSFSEEKQQKFSSEVSYLYIPIAHRLGLYNIKSEFEELLMKYENPEIYDEISRKLHATKSKRNVFIQEFIDPIQRKLILQKLDCDIIGRPKSIHSIWNKMKKQNLEFEQVFDLFAIRITSNSKLKNEKLDCWRIYSIVTDIFQPNPKRLRDWITTPKASGYESLHTTVLGQNKKWVEVQIRTKRMDEVAEKGRAAHWIYKGLDKKKDSEEWLNQIRDILENPDQINFDIEVGRKKDNPNDKVYIFTPNGDLKKLEYGSTILDFAFEIHTDVGSKCSGAKVNNKLVQIKHVLHNGDKVEIITSKNQKPKLDWLNFVITNKAKAKIKRSLLEDKYKEADNGNQILRRKLKNWKIPFNDESIDKLIKHYKFKSSVDLYYSIAVEKLDLAEVKKLLVEKAGNALPKKNGESKTIAYEEISKQLEKSEEEFLEIDDKIKNVSYNLAKCCNPISGDAVFGFITVGKGITIHRVNCPNAAQMLSKYDYRIIDVKWKDADQVHFQTIIKVTGVDEIGLLKQISKVISNDLKVNMMSISADSKNGMFEGKIKVSVKDTRHLDELLFKLVKIKGVTKATRIDSFK